MRKSATRRLVLLDEFAIAAQGVLCNLNRLDVISLSTGLHLKRLHVAIQIINWLQSFPGTIGTPARFPNCRKCFCGPQA